MSIPDDLSPALGDNLVSRPVTASGISDPQNEDDDTFTVALSKYRANDLYSANPYHVRLDQIATDPANPISAYELRITLRGSRFAFFTIPASAETGGFPIQGVGIGKPNGGAADFCFSKLIVPTGAIRHSTVVLFVTYHAPSAATKTETGLNIFLAPQTAQDTPIIIDPKVENNG